MKVMFESEYEEYLKNTKDFIDINPKDYDENLYIVVTDKGGVSQASQLPEGKPINFKNMINCRLLTARGPGINYDYAANTAKVYKGAIYIDPQDLKPMREILRVWNASVSRKHFGDHKEYFRKR